MAVVTFSPGKTSVIATVRTRQQTNPPPLENIPGGLFPLRMALWETDEYRLASGWPVSVPELDIRARSLVSCEGEVLGYRESPRGITTGAMVRWIADDDLYSDIDLRWHPVYADQPVVWESAADYSPTYINDFEYKYGHEVLYKDAINFDSDSYEHMWTNLSTALGGATGYTMLMVASLNSVYGDRDLPYTGIWCPGQPTPGIGTQISETPDGGWVSLTLQGTALYLETDQSPRVKALDIAHLVASTAPLMIAMVVGRPYTTLYAGRGPTAISKASLNVGAQQVALDGNVLLGRTNGDILHTADMALMDLGIYPDRLTPSEVVNEFSLLAGVYGGDK